MTGKALLNMLGVNHSDTLQTPGYAIEPLLPYLDKYKVIWECACGNGNLVRAFAAKGFSVFGTDILKDADFLQFNGISEIDYIITNPPYSIKDAFLAKAYELGKPFAFLLPLTALEGKKRQALYKRYGLEVILLNKRIHFEVPSGKKNVWFATAWFTHGLNIGRDLTFYEFSS